MQRYSCRYLVKFTHHRPNTCKDPRGIRNCVFVTRNGRRFANMDTFLFPRERMKGYVRNQPWEKSFLLFSPLTNRIRIILSSQAFQLLFIAFIIFKKFEHMYTKIVCTYVNKFEIISSLFYSLASFKFFFFFFTLHWPSHLTSSPL